jgi:hypothetical protein
MYLFIYFGLHEFETFGLKIEVIDPSLSTPSHGQNDPKNHGF